MPIFISLSFNFFIYDFALSNGSFRPAVGGDNNLSAPPPPQFYSIFVMLQLYLNVESGVKEGVDD